MTRPLIPLERIPGTDIGNIGESWRPPEAPLFVAAKIMRGKSLGALTVCDSRGGLQEAGFLSSGEFMVTLGSGLAWNEVAIEPADYPRSHVDPCNRGGAAYAPFKLEAAREVLLKNGGRLLIAGGIMGSDSLLPLELLPSTVGDPVDTLPTQIHRVTSSIAETELALQAIGIYAGLSKADSATLANAALDFSRT